VTLDNVWMVEEKLLWKVTKRKDVTETLCKSACKKWKCV